MPFIIKSYHKSELADMYNISLTTLATWLKPLQEKKLIELTPRQKILKPNEVKIIVENLGQPYNEVESE